MDGPGIGPLVTGKITFDLPDRRETEACALRYGHELSPAGTREGKPPQDNSTT